MWIDCSIGRGTRVFPHASLTGIPMWKDERFVQRIAPKIPRLDSAGKNGQN
jgi:hypothetical protein